MVLKIYQHRGKIPGIVLSLFITSKSENTYICICMPKSGEKKEDKMDEMVGWPDHIITYYIVGKLRLTMGGEIIYEEAILMSCLHIVTIYLPDIYAVDSTVAIR